MDETTSLTKQDIKVEHISNNPLDNLRVGDFYWVKFEDTKWDGDKKVKVGEHETLMCIEVIGSNYVGLTICEDRHASDTRVHFDEFAETCRHEPNWRQILNDRMESARLAIQEKTRELIMEGQKVSLLPAETTAPSENPTLLPARVSVDQKKYKRDLIRIQKSLPEISKEIEQLGEDLALAAKNVSLPDLVKLNSIKEALEKVEDRIFTVELYCGLQEEVHQIADGEAAPIGTPITIRQQILFMDEETLFDYESGGMDFSKIIKFDQWAVKPENLSRLLPDQRGIVAMRVRRNDKDYGHATDISTALAHFQWKCANEQTYLLIRNGQKVYRIASTVNFMPRLIPKKDEIGKDQFRKEEHFWDRNPEKPAEYVTQDSVNFDDHMKKAEALIRHYNRIVILVQGLLDRSQVFHPHPAINLRNAVDMEKWLVLIRDEELGLPNNKVSFEEYQKQVNASLGTGKWVYVDSAYDERFPKGENPNYPGRRFEEKPKRGWATNSMPRLRKVDSMKRDGSAIQVSWPKGKLCTEKRGLWIESKTRPGYDHYEYDSTTDRLCHEWIPVNRVLNLSDYHLGDYKMFLCDRALQGEYLKWAKYLLTAEDWARARAKGIPPEDDDRAQTRE